MRRPWVAGALGAWAQLMVKRAAVAGVLVSSVAGLLVSGTSQATAADAVPPSQLVAVDRARAVGLQGIRTETYAAVPVDYDRNGRQVTFINVNGDRWPDLFLSNDIPRRDRDDPCNVTANRLPNERGKVFLNVGGRRFQYVKRLWNFGPGIGTRCAEPLDFDRDGWQDLLACLGPNESPRLYRNRSGRGFADVTSRYPLSQGMSDAVVVDLDRDGDRDVVSSSADGFGYYPSVRGDLGPRVLIGTVASGQGGSVAVGDADGDGDNDVYGLTWQGRTVNPDDQIWINHLGSFVPIAVPSAQGAG